MTRRKEIRIYAEEFSGKARIKKVKVTGLKDCRLADMSKTGLRVVTPAPSSMKPGEETEISISLERHKDVTLRLRTLPSADGGISFSIMEGADGKDRYDAFIDSVLAERTKDNTSPPRHWATADRHFKSAITIRGDSRFSNCSEDLTNMNLPIKLPVFISILTLFCSLAAAQQTNYKPVPYSDIKLDSAHKFVAACITSIKQLEKGNTLVLAGLTDTNGCDEPSFTSYAVYLGDSEGKPIKYLGEETAKADAFYSNSIYISDFGRDFAVIEQYGKDGYSRSRYSFSLDPKNISDILRQEFLPEGVHTLYYNSGGLYFVGGGRDSVVGRIALTKGKVGAISLLKSRAGRNVLKDIVNIETDDKNGFAVKMETGRYIFSGKGWEFVEAETEESAPVQPSEVRLGGNPTVDTTIFSTTSANSQTQENLTPGESNTSPKITQVTHEEITVDLKGESRSYPIPPLSKETVEKNFQFTDCDPVHSIGPYAVYGDSVVFGIDIYSGESACGVGGLGIFSPNDGKYDFRYYKEIARYSSTALFIRNNTAYFGLSLEGEYSSSPEGLAEIDLNSGKVKLRKLPYLVKTLLEQDGTLFAGTDNGILIIYPSGLISHLGLDLDNEGNCLYSLSATKSNEKL